MEASSKERPILLFDGVCNLCNAAVQFCLEHDKEGKLRFASLQSEVGQAFLKKFNLSSEDLTTIVLVEGDKHYIESTAALRISKHFGGVWSVFYSLVIVPKPLRDLVYRYISKNRYRWFGKKESCMMPTEDVSHRFI